MWTLLTGCKMYWLAITLIFTVLSSSGCSSLWQGQGASPSSQGSESTSQTSSSPSTDTDTTKKEPIKSIKTDEGKSASPKGGAEVSTPKPQKETKGDVSPSKPMTKPVKEKNDISRKGKPGESQPEVVLTPDLSDGTNVQLEKEADVKIKEAEELMKHIIPDGLNSQENEVHMTVQNFITKAGEAMTKKDFPLALNLATKAHTLANELAQSSNNK